MSILLSRIRLVRYVVECLLRNWYPGTVPCQMRTNGTYVGAGKRYAVRHADAPDCCRVTSLIVSIVTLQTALQVVWAVRHKYIGNTFFDASASKFFLQNVAKKKTPPSRRTGQTIAAKNSSSVGPDWTFQGVGKQEPDSTNRPQSFLDIQFECELGDVRGGEGSSLVSATLTNGVCVEADFVVSATGVLPITSVVSSEFKVKLLSTHALEVKLFGLSGYEICPSARSMPFVCVLPCLLLQNQPERARWGLVRR